MIREQERIRVKSGINLHKYDFLEYSLEIRF